MKIRQLLSRTDIPYWVRFLVLAAVFWVVAMWEFLPRMEELRFWSPPPIMDLVQVLGITTLMTLWIPAVLARWLGRKFQWDRFIGFAAVTVFLGHEVHIRALVNMNSWPMLC